jgi:dTDP-4-dehydrorhamnose reductase
MIWLIGSKGQLGSELGLQLSMAGLKWTGSDKDVDIRNYQTLKNFAAEMDEPPEWIINCAAFTNVEEAEENEEMAFSLNVTGTSSIVKLCQETGAKLIHISTDYVFDGLSSAPYKEFESTGPLNVYGKTKALSEAEVSNHLKEYYIIRTAWLYGFQGENFVYKMIRLMNAKDEIKVVDDQKGTPTSAVDLAFAIIKLIEANGRNGGKSPSYGIYHYTDGGECSWYDFAKEIYSLGKECGKIHSPCIINKCLSADFETKAKRPAYSVLNKDKISIALNMELPDWRISLANFIFSDSFNLS